MTNVMTAGHCALGSSCAVEPPYRRLYDNGSWGEDRRLLTFKYPIILRSYNYNLLFLYKETETRSEVTWPCSCCWTEAKSGCYPRASLMRRLTSPPVQAHSWLMIYVPHRLPSYHAQFNSFPPSHRALWLSPWATFCLPPKETQAP